jgi:hypothetical protein
MASLTPLGRRSGWFCWDKPSRCCGSEEFEVVELLCWVRAEMRSERSC